VELRKPAEAQQHLFLVDEQRSTTADSRERVWRVHVKADGPLATLVGMPPKSSWPPRDSLVSQR